MTEWLCEIHGISPQGFSSLQLNSYLTVAFCLWATQLFLALHLRKLSQTHREYLTISDYAKTPVAVKIVDFIVWGFDNSFGVSRSTRKLRKSCSSTRVREIYRRWGSIRFQPKRRASTDHAPGPIIASAAPRAPNSMQIHRLSQRDDTFRSSKSAVRIPAIGVQRPNRNRTPTPVAKTANMTDCTECPVGHGMIA